MISRFTQFILPIYWAILTYLFLKPGHIDTPGWWTPLYPDKIVHLICFLFFGLLVKLKWPKLSFFSIFSIIFLYGGGIELLQKFMNMGRSAEWADLLADVIGGMLGIYIGQILYNLKLKK